MGIIFSRNSSLLSFTHTTNDSNYDNLKKKVKVAKKYLASYYYLAGNRFESSETQSYLFGEKSDLDYLLSSKPVMVESHFYS